MNDAEVRLTELRRLTSARREAELAEQKAAALHREARARRREAEQAVARWLSADAEPCPLFDGLGATPCVAPATSGVAGGDVTPDVTSKVVEFLLAGQGGDVLVPPPACVPPQGGEVPLDLPARPGQRKLADLVVREQRAALWLTVDGEHVVVFDYSRFGNWARNDLPSGEYWPTTEEVAAEATKATGYALDSWDWGPCAEAPLLWEIVLDVKRTGDHPERWRLSRLEWMPDRWSRPLKQHGVTSFGDLISRLEAGTFSLDRIKGAPRKPLEPFASPLAEFVSLLRDFWEKQTIEGERGNFPAWLPRPIDLPPVFSAPKKSKRKGGEE